jgi:hypothetical protein
LSDDGRGPSGGGGGSGGSNQQGSGGGNRQGNAGTGGGNGNQQVPDEGDLVFEGGDVDDADIVFPFQAAVAPNGDIFVSTLGAPNIQGNDEFGRIYRFKNGDDTPELMFQVAKANAAVYGLVFAKGKMYACVSEHIDSNIGDVNASVFEFQPYQLGSADVLSPSDVTQIQLISNAVNDNNNGFIFVQAKEAAGRCGPLTTDGSFIYAADISGGIDGQGNGSGRNNFIYRIDPSKPNGNDDNPSDANTNDGDSIPNSDIGKYRVTAWFNDPQLNTVTNFGATALAFDGAILRVLTEQEDQTVFGLNAGGLVPELGGFQDSLDFTAGDEIADPFGLVKIDTNEFLISDRATDTVFRALLDSGELRVNNVLEVNNVQTSQQSFVDPGNITVVGDKYLVVGTQFNNLGGAGVDSFTVYIRDIP